MEVFPVMKRTLLFALLTALMCCLPACAEEVSLAPYALTLPAEVAVQPNEGSITYVVGDTRVVAMVISRVPDETPGAALPRLMEQFDEQAIFGADLVLQEGFVGMMATTPDKYGEGIDLRTVMVLHEGELLILSGYDMTGDTQKTDALLETLLTALTLDGMPVMPSPDA